jgi:four helix bundle protein
MFEDLVVYQKAMEFVERIYLITRGMPEKEIKDQIKRAALSIPLNIAEGNGRNTVKEKSQFYKTARGSLFECVPLLQLCLRLGLFPKETYDKLYPLSEEIGKMLNGLINSLDKTFRN